MEGIAGGLYLPGQELTNSSHTECCDSNGLFPSKNKGIASEISNQGLDESVLPFNVDSTQDLHRALSLLSTKSWASSQPKLPFEQPVPTAHTSITPSLQHVTPQGLQVASSDYWRTEQQSTDSQVHTSHGDISNYFQDLQPLRVPYECDFYCNQLN
uniref:Uncharacterized protein MANES_12G010200 n=1 Tax=Rhizophora mucronata TaxID=61149 RepID=A0A2P2KV97_RHIMU